MTSYERERQVAVEAVAEAAVLCRAVQTEIAAVDTLQKDDRSPVTIADFGSQALICRRIADAFPQDSIVGEEDSAELRQEANSERLEAVTVYVQSHIAGATEGKVCDWIDAGNGTVATRFWTLDPIDGTKGFLRGDQYAVALALIENGAVRLGVLACPALPLDLDQTDSPVGSLFAAVHSEGAFMGNIDGTGLRPVSVQRNDAVGNLRFVESVESGHGNSELQESVARAAGIDRAPLKLDSQVKYGALARGDATLYLRFPSPRQATYREKIWDHAAGAIIVDEAGGKVSDMDGRALDFATSPRLREGAGVVASNGQVHEAVLNELAKRR